MGFADELARAGQGLIDSINGLKTQRAVSEAKDQLDQIRNSEWKDEEKKTAIRTLSQDLALNLTARAGMSPTAAQGFAEQIAPKPPLIQSIDQGLLSDDPIVQKRAQEVRDQQYGQQMRMLEAKRDADLAGYGIKSDAKTLEKQGKAQKDFQAQTKKFFEGRDSIGMLEGLASMDQRVAIDLAKKTLNKLSGDDRTSDADYNAINLDPRLWGTVKQQIDRLASGTASPTEITNLKEIGQVLAAATKRTGAKKINSWALANAEDYGYSDPARLAQKLGMQFLQDPDTNKYVQEPHLKVGAAPPQAQQQQAAPGQAPAPAAAGQPAQPGRMFAPKGPVRSTQSIPGTEGKPAAYAADPKLSPFENAYNELITKNPSRAASWGTYKPGQIPLKVDKGYSSDAKKLVEIRQGEEKKAARMAELEKQRKEQQEIVWARVQAAQKKAKKKK